MYGMPSEYKPSIQCNDVNCSNDSFSCSLEDDVNPSSVNIFSPVKYTKRLMGIKVKGLLIQVIATAMGRLALSNIARSPAHSIWRGRGRKLINTPIAAARAQLRR